MLDGGGKNDAPDRGSRLQASEAVLRSRLGELLHSCSVDELNAVSHALRAAQDLCRTRAYAPRIYPRDLSR
jgi:hypothetical protein